MSLINDALKRAKQAQQKHLPPPAPASPLRPVVAMRSNTPSLVVLWACASFALLVVGGAAIWMAFRPHDSLQTATAEAYVKSPSRPAMAKPQSAPSSSFPKPITPNSEPTVLAAITPKPSATAIRAVENPAPSASPHSPLMAQATARQASTIDATAFIQPTAQPIATGVALNPAPVSVPASVVTNEAPRSPPPLPKLQGIFYRPGRPLAVLSGKTVLIGSMSGEYRVAAIDQTTVTLIRSGQTNVLSLPE
jgi:hypothetical protein